MMGDHLTGSWKSTIVAHSSQRGNTMWYSQAECVCLCVCVCVSACMCAGVCTFVWVGA